MNARTSASVLIVGAGSMGIIMGYHLSLAGADISYLVRPHRQEQLGREQRLYSYDDNTLEIWSDYTLLTDPQQIKGKTFDYVLVTLDGAALRSEAGIKVVDAIGAACRGTSTGVILGSLGFDLRSWFIDRSGLAESQVTMSLVGALIYEVQKVDLPVHDGVDRALLATADYGYKHLSDAGITVDLSAPDVAHGFADLFDRNGVTRCNVMPVDDFATMVTGLGAIMGWELLGWPPLATIDPADSNWKLGVEAMREFQQLPAFGQAAADAAEALTPEGVHAMFVGLGQAALPIDFAAFNRYHHGDKVNAQDHAILRDALERGQAEGRSMPALEALVARLPG